MRVALAGDTMLGRGVAEAMRSRPPASLVSHDVVTAAAEADVFVLNLECCISERGTKWPAPGKPFFFRAPPHATELLAHLGVDCVSLANNHALDFGYDALLDTFGHLDRAGIAWVGAGPDVARARARVMVKKLAVVAFTDHPAEFAATDTRPGVAYADLREGVPPWARESAAGALVTPHWGPNMQAAPVPHVVRAAAELEAAGATLVAGHSAHVFQGVAGRVLYDLGDFLDDYRVDPVLRNDLGVLFLVDVGDAGPGRIEALPLKLDFCYTRLADGEDAAWIRRRLRELCAALGADVRKEDGRIVITPRARPVPPRDGAAPRA